jgi:hypothetical protein
MRAAMIAGHGLGVKATVFHIGIFRGALFTHWEYIHGRIGAVVGKGLDNAETWSAIRAIDKGIIDAMWLCFHIFEASGTNSDIRAYFRNLVFNAVIAAVHNAEILEGLMFDFFRINTFNHSGTGGFSADAVDKGFGFFSLNQNQYALIAVIHRASQSKLLCQAVNKRPEADALHQPGDFYAICAN